jgi:putative glutamine amidotransferase
MIRLFLILFFLPLAAFADLSLVRWQPEGFSRAFLIPAREGETTAQARDRYLKTLEQDPALKDFAKNLRAAKSGSLEKFKNGNEPFVLVLANDADDLVPAQERVLRVSDPLVKRGATAMVAPVAVTAGLDATEVEEFHGLVNREVDLLLAVGGDDIHPSLYGDPDPNQLSRGTNLARDKEELGIVRSYLDEGKGFFSGICRGHQLGGVASGCQLIKDIETELKVDHPRHVNHQVVPRSPAKLTEQLFAGDGSLEVTSNHHQAVKVPSRTNKRIKVTALSAKDKKIAEISEYLGGRGLSVQGHPEDMGVKEFHERFYRLVFDEARKASDQRRLAAAPFKNIDLEKTLFGVEYTFQDQGMVDEPGRMTMETPHKRAKFNRFRSAYLEELGLSNKALDGFGRGDFKPGNTITVPGDGEHVMNMEPVTIEVNTTPKIFREIEPAAEKIYRASEQADLLPYVQPAAERSGMGHIHVGGAKLGDSPFYKNPLLLRNMMVYEHKHPSVLWGFAEAYDIGPNSNIETHHGSNRKGGFEKAVAKFDAWYEKTKKSGGDLSDGLRQFLRALYEQDEIVGFDKSYFRHYRFMNLEHLKTLANSHQPLDPNLEGKFTVEFRNFRPPKTPGHAKANAEFLLTLMDKMAEPGHLEKFESVSEAAYDRFHTATKVAADWEKVKKDLPRLNPLWDDAVGEYVSVQAGAEAVRAKLPNGVMAEIRPAYSPKGDKGTKFEIRLPAKDTKAPAVELAGKPLKFEKVKVGKDSYWLSVFNTDEKFFPAVVNTLGGPRACSKWFRDLR